METDIQGWQSDRLVRLYARRESFLSNMLPNSRLCDAEKKCGLFEATARGSSSLVFLLSGAATTAGRITGAVS